MRRFGDILRLLSSLVLGLMVRDIDDIIKGLQAFYYPPVREENWGRTVAHDDLLASVTALALIALFFRNIHGSSAYDDWLATGGQTPRFEKHRIGKGVTFGMLLSTLFIAPALSVHEFARHFGPQRSLESISVLLFASFWLYFIWNLCLWSFDGEYSETGKPTIADLALVWLRIDTVSIALVLGFGAICVYLGATKKPIPPESIGWCFCLVAFWTVIADYWYNRQLYFPDK
jgi:hypothetical protein